MRAAGAVYVAVALAWLTATLLVPAHDRPYAIGSTNGSAWNAAFVFNGTDRLGGKSPEPQQTVYQPGHRYPVATQSERDHIPIVPPSPTRLLARIGPLSGERLGLELLVALLLGVPALIATLLVDRRSAREAAAPAADADEQQAAGRRMRRAVAAGLSLWTLTGIALFSDMTRLHPRYVEGFVPAVAALLGIGVAWACAATGKRPPAGRVWSRWSWHWWRASTTSSGCCIGRTGVWWIAARRRARRDRVRGARPPRPARRRQAPRLARRRNDRADARGGAALPLSADVTSIDDGVTDAGYVGALPGEEQRLVSAYLRAHQGDARYELAAESATQIGSLIVQDARPVLILTTYDARVFTTVPELQRAIAKGEVRYAFLNSFCGKHISHRSTPPARNPPGGSARTAPMCRGRRA